MLGLSDRTQIFDLAEALLRGDARGTLVQFADMHDSGADPVALIQDMLELTHWLTRLRLAPDYADAATVAEAVRDRKRVVEGKRGIVRVVFRGRRNNQNKTNNTEDKLQST